jgi:hypothetical protein
MPGDYAALAGDSAAASASAAGGTPIIDPMMLAPSLRSTTRIMPKTAEPPIGRSGATRPNSGALASLFNVG